jgi:phosphate transport system protein
MSQGGTDERPQAEESMTPSLRSHFDRELARLAEQLLEVGSRARRAVDLGVQAFATGNGELAHEVISADTAINALRYRIEEACYALLALEQPMAGDLRTIVATLIMVNEFERIADHGKKLARICLRNTGDQGLSPNEDVLRMRAIVLSMLERVMVAVATRNVAEARALCRLDDDVDAHYRQLFNVTLSYMLENPRLIGPGTYHIQAGHELERIGDRVTNVAERLIYAVTGDMMDLNA